MMRKLALILFAFGCIQAHAAVCSTVSSGASASTVQTAINACGSGNTLMFASAGTWTFGTQLSIACGVSLSGPVIPYPGPGPFSGNGPFLATINSTVTGTWLFTLPGSACTSQITISNLNINGGQPSPDGGGLIYFPTSGGSNVTITNNYLHGNYANQCSTTLGPPTCVTANLTKAYDSLIWMDGSPGGATWANVTISFNHFGASTDCNTIMTSLFYQGTAYNGPVGLCAGVGVHTNTNNFLISNNSFYHMEQGIKFYEGNSTAPFYACGASNAPSCFVTRFNDFSNIHRNPIEGQMVNMTITNNSVHDAFSPGDASWGFSLPQLNCNVVTNNLEIANSTVVDYYPGAQEYWGSCNSSNNLIQGKWGLPSQGANSGAIQWGFNGNTAPYTGPATVSNNIIQVTNGLYITDEGYGQPAPTRNGNVTSTAISTVTSHVPVISPAGGAQAYPLTVTVTDTGDTSGVGPQGNTGIWYTTDGSTPVPGAGTATYLASGGTFSLGAAGTVKAVGMWGAVNQPSSYASGYGFVPSAVVSQTFTGSSVTHPVNASQSESTIQGIVSAASAGDTISFAAGTYNWGSTLTVKCGLTYTGPVATPATAILNNTGGAINIMHFGTCTTQTTWQYLQFVGGGIYGDISNHSNISYLHNQALSIPGDSVCGTGNETCENALFFDGNSGTNNILSNLTIEYNTFGDANSCASNMSGNHNGVCSGVFTQVGTLTNITSRYNLFTHLEEGLHHLYTTTYNPGSRASTEDNIDIEYNVFTGIHRNFVELQMQVINNPSVVSHNLFGPPINPYNDTLTLSGACCQFTNIYGHATITPALVFQDNVEYNNLPSSSNSAFFQELWGQGPQSVNNVLQGSSCNGVEWGFVGDPVLINYNVIQGPWMSARTPCNVSPISSAFINNEEGQPNVPTTTGNLTGATPTAITSRAPVISPTPTGTYSAPISVTITIPVSLTSIPSGLNTVAYYTTDGSTPTTSSTQCNVPPATSCTFSVPPGTTLSAISMWGYRDSQFTQVTSAFPAGFGYVQSTVQAAQYISSGGTPTLQGVAITLTGGGSSVQVGKSIPAIANCSYTGQITTNCTIMDSYGTTANTWASSDTTKANVSGTGSVSGQAAGSTNLTVHAGTFTSPPFTVTVTPAAPVLQSVTLSCPSPINITQTSTCTATCNYSGPQALNCTTTDANNNVASGWSSSNTATATVSGNVATGVAGGTTNITASAGGIPSSPVQLTVNSPPPATLTGVTVACTNGSVVVGSTTTCNATCAYSDLTTTVCTTMDAHGTTATSWTSSVTADATINPTTGVLMGVAVGSTNISVTAGSFTAPNVAVPVTAAPTTSVLGNNQFNTAGGTSANFINATYAVTGAVPAGYPVTSCSFYLPAGTTYTAGSKWDCGLVLAPSATTQATSWLCHATYTTLGTTADVGWHTLNIVNCGTLPPSTAYWISVDTNEAGSPGQGFWNCGSSCTGSAPTSGNGTYPCRYISASYGVYTGMGTAMNAGCGAAGLQASQYVTLTNPTPTLTGISVAPVTFANTLVVGGTFLFNATCAYSDNTTFNCFPSTDPWGNTVTHWASSVPSVMTIGDIGSAHPGLATGISMGQSFVQATVTGGHLSSLWGVTINAPVTGFAPTSSKIFSR